jgi:DNA-binding transcriptional ArsR family regulator
MAEKSIMIDLDDPQASLVAEIIGNKTCKKILSLLADSELSESDIANKLNLPLNTVEYNIKKLEKAGLIEKSKKFFWSPKGKKILTYKVIDKRIVILPRKKLTGVLPAIIVSGIFAAGVWIYQNSKQVAQQTFKSAPSLMADNSDAGIETATVAASSSATLSPVAWFILGALLAIVTYVAWNKLKR